MFPSVCYETYGLSIVESFACGKPVLGADIGAISELITPDVGRVFEAKNAEDLRDNILFLLDNRDEIVRLGNNARKKAEDLCSEERHVKKIEDLYRSLISSPE